MASLFNRMRSSATGSHPSITSPSKKDANAPQLTSLEKHLQDSGPLRDDGSDKFWGLENFGNTCYANSVIQCLYYSVPFRQHVMSYPKPTPYDAVINSPNGQQRLHTNTTSLPLNHPSLTYTKLMNRQNAQNPSARNPAGPPTTPKPEDRDHPDFKKRVAQARGPTLAMNYENASAYEMPESLFTSIKDIFEALAFHQSRTGVVSPSRFLDVLKRDNEAYRTAQHQDAHEFLNLLLNDVLEHIETHSKKLQEEKGLKGPIEKSDFEQELMRAMPHVQGGTSWVHELFEGTLTSETKCLTCDNTSQRDEVFLDLSLDLEEHASVTSCLRKFSEEEMLCERNKFHCDNCGGLQEAEKRMKIKRLPKILALHLKRFKYADDMQRMQKLFHRVVYPYHLRLFNTTDDADDPDRLYELYAVVVHIGGGPYHGHYVSIVKTEDRGWLLFDDEMVEPVDKSYVQNFFGDKPGLACAYVLFYKETTIDEMRREQEAENQVLAPKVIAPVKEGPTLALKANGFLGSLHHVKSAMTPASPDEGHENLDRVASEPALAAAHNHVFDGEVTALPEIPANMASPDEVKSKKERQKEDKERRAAARSQAKEEEKAEKERRKVMDRERREKAKSLDVEASLRQTIVPASPAKADVEKRNVTDNGATSTNGSMSGLSRFRNTSKSFRKPKFLGGTSRESSKEEPAVNGIDVLTTPLYQDTELIEKPLEKPPEKAKNRFSALRKKTSNMML